MSATSLCARLRLAFPALAFLVASLTPCAKASYLVTIAPDHLGNVIAIGSGTINTTDLTNEGGSSWSAMIWPTFGSGSLEVTGPTSFVGVQVYTGITGPISFGSGVRTDADSGSGDTAGIIAGDGLLLPAGYTSGAALSETSTYADATISSLGLTPGVYAYTWGSGGTADSFTVEISSDTPEPASFVLLAISAAFLLFTRRGRFSRAR